MVNCNSLQHGLTTANQTRPKSKQWKRRNKAAARARALARQDALREMLVKGN